MITEAPIEFITPLKDIEVPEKSTATLECEVSKPNVKADWTKNKEPITVQDGYDIRADKTYHTLHLEKVGPEDGAEYTITVGEKSSTAKLTVKGKNM